LTATSACVKVRPASSSAAAAAAGARVQCFADRPVAHGDPEGAGGDRGDMCPPWVEHRDSAHPGEARREDAADGAAADDEDGRFHPVTS